MYIQIYEEATGAKKGGTTQPSPGRFVELTEVERNKGIYSVSGTSSAQDMGLTSLHNNMLLSSTPSSFMHTKEGFGSTHGQMSKHEIFSKIHKFSGHDKSDYNSKINLFEQLMANYDGAGKLTQKYAKMLYSSQHRTQRQRKVDQQQTSGNGTGVGGKKETKSTDTQKHLQLNQKSVNNLNEQSGNIMIVNQQSRNALQSQKDFDISLKMAKDVQTFAKANLRDFSSDRDQESDTQSQNSLIKLRKAASKAGQIASGGLISSTSLQAILNNESAPEGLRSQPGLNINSSIAITDESTRQLDHEYMNSSIVIGGQSISNGKRHRYLKRAVSKEQKSSEYDPSPMRSSFSILLKKKENGRAQKFAHVERITDNCSQVKLQNAAGDQSNDQASADDHEEYIKLHSKLDLDTTFGSKRQSRTVNGKQLSNTARIVSLKGKIPEVSTLGRNQG